MGNNFPFIMAISWGILLSVFNINFFRQTVKFCPLIRFGSYYVPLNYCLYLSKLILRFFYKICNEENENYFLSFINKPRTDLYFWHCNADRSGVNMNTESCRTSSTYFCNILCGQSYCCCNRHFLQKMKLSWILNSINF